MVASALAATIALHNAAARYIFALPREGMLPPAFGLASLGIASLQAVTSAAVIATVCLAGIALLIVLNYSVLAGDLGGLDHAPWLMVLADGSEPPLPRPCGKPGQGSPSPTSTRQPLRQRPPALAAMR